MQIIFPIPPNHSSLSSSLPNSLTLSNEKIGKRQKTNMPLQYSLLVSLLTFSLLHRPSSSATDTFVYGGCSRLRYNPGTVIETNVNSVLTSVVNAASLNNFNNFKISVPGSTQSDVIYGLYQCRGDLSSSDCNTCVAHSVSRLGVLCPDSAGGVVQLEGCLVKYDNQSFLGVEDKTVVLKKCGPSIGYDSDMLNRRDAVLAYLTAAGGQYFRVGGSGSVQAAAQCTQDLSGGECADCLTEATAQLRSQCVSAAWGDMYLGKCYARYSERGQFSSSGHDENDDNDMNKTLAIIIGGIAGVALIIVFLSFLTKLCDRKDGK